VWKHWWCLTRKFAKSALRQSKRTFEDAFHLAHTVTVPVEFSADSELIKNSVLLLPEPLNVNVMTRESGSGKRERSKDGQEYFVVGKKDELVWLHVSDHPTSQYDSLRTLQNGCDVSS